MRPTDHESDPAFDILSEVELKSFKISDTEITALEQITLEWEVTGEGQFHITINYSQVPKRGSHMDAPQHDTTYVLKALSGGYERTLGHVSVKVNADSCSILAVQDPAITVSDAFDDFIRASSEVYYAHVFKWVNGQMVLVPSTPEVSVADGSIHFNLFLKTRRKDWYDADLTVRGSFGLVVNDGSLAASYKSVTAEAGVPLLPDCPWEDEIAAGKQRAIERFTELIDYILILFNGELSAIPEGRKAFSVKIGSNVLEVRHCPVSRKPAVLDTVSIRPVNT